MQIEVNIKDKRGHECGVYVLHKFDEGYFWSLVKFGKNKNCLPTIIKSTNHTKWIRGDYGYIYETLPFSEEDLMETSVWTT